MVRRWFRYSACCAFNLFFYFCTKGWEFPWSCRCADNKLFAKMWGWAMVFTSDIYNQSAMANIVYGGCSFCAIVLRALTPNRSMDRRMSWPLQKPVDRYLAGAHNLCLVEYTVVQPTLLFCLLKMSAPRGVVSLSTRAWLYLLLSYSILDHPLFTCSPDFTFPRLPSCAGPHGFIRQSFILYCQNMIDRWLQNSKLNPRIAVKLTPHANLESKLLGWGLPWVWAKNNRKTKRIGQDLRENFELDHLLSSVVLISRVIHDGSGVAHEFFCLLSAIVFRPLGIGGGGASADLFHCLWFSASPYLSSSYFALPFLPVFVNLQVKIWKE